MAEAKEKSIQTLHEHELMLTVSRQRQLIFFLLLTLSLIGVIIVLFALVRHRKKLLVEKEKEMLQLNELLAKLQQTKETRPQPAENQPSSSTIVLTGNTSENVSLEIANLLYMEAVGNYVKVYQLCDGKVKIDMLRVTLKQLEDDLRSYPTIVRCHRAFLVNLEQVERIESHSNSTQLIIKYSNDHLPVSRSNMAQVKAAIKELA